ncbi:MAG TPA: hypothetical protein VHV82_05510 [Sporichthyaceae bacterium]|nr:hypothetical protein [Sporichthyaceae bacterium]
MPVTVWPVDPVSRRTLPTHEHAAGGGVREFRGELAVLGAPPADVLDQAGPLTAPEAEAPPLATYGKGAWFRAVVTDADGQVVDEVGVVA